MKMEDEHGGTNCVGERGERKTAERKEREDQHNGDGKRLQRKGVCSHFWRYCFFSYQLGDDLFLLGHFLCICVC